MWAVLKREYLERVRPRWFLFATPFGPLLFAALMFLPAYIGDNAKASENINRIRILDARGTDLGEIKAYDLGGGLAGNSSATQVLAVEEG